MKIALITALTLGACVPTPPPCGLPNLPTEIIYTKEGFPIIIEKALSIPCVEVTPSNDRQPPVVGPPPVEPPTTEKVKGNNGFGNGDQDAPGNSEHNNNAENRGGNHNGRDDAPGRSWHE